MSQVNTQKYVPSTAWSQYAQADYLAQFLLSAAIYFLLAWVGLQFTVLHQNVSPIWPAAGFALALVLVRFSLWPAIGFGALLANFLLTDVGFLPALGLSVGNAGEAAIGAFLIQRYTQPAKVLTGSREAGAFILFGALLATVSSATLGNLVLLLAGHARLEQFSTLWTTWWVGDAIGQLVFTPFFLAIFFRHELDNFSERRTERALLLALTVITGGFGFLELFSFLFGTLKPASYFVVPALILGAMRGGPVVRTTQLLIISLMASIGAALSQGIFARFAPGVSALNVEVFLGVMSVTLLLFGASIAEAKEKAETLKSEVEARRLSEERLRESNARYAELVEDLRQAEDKMRAQAAQLLRVNSELEYFASTASHDLKAPLRVISNYVQLLSVRYKGKLDADADEVIGFAVEASKRMALLIDDLLDYSRAADKPTQGEVADLDEVVDRVLSDLKPMIEESGASVTRDELPQVAGNRAQLGLVFQNLLANALKYRRKGITPVVRVGAECRDGEWILTIADNGVGIAKEYQEKIFRLFQRLGTAHGVAGTGIGLATCKRVVEHLGGRIWVDSTVGVGSAFHFSIPMVEGRNIASGPARTSNGPKNVAVEHRA